MAKPKDIDTESWIPVFEANARHQANVGSSGIARDLLKAIIGGTLEIRVQNPLAGNQIGISSDQLANRPPDVWIHRTIADAPFGPLVDFNGYTAIVNRAEFEKWSAANQRKRGSRQPMRQAANELLQKWYPPDGAPPKSISDKEIYRDVCRSLEDSGRKHLPSQETVRRAAGRRKSG